MKQSLAALHNTVLRISSQNTDTALGPLITDAIAQCHHLHKLLESTVPAEATALMAVVDEKIFQRLMALAGPDTAMELLGQLMLDLGAAQKSIAAAAPNHDWAVMRKECHVLIAIAGSIGAFQVMTSAEALQRDVQRRDESAATTEAHILLHLLESLITFVQDQRKAKAAS